MLTVCNAESSVCSLNATIDSLYLRILRQCIPTQWLREQIPKWREFQRTSDQETEPYMVEIPGLGTFELKPFGQRPYAFCFVNKELANVYIWNPDKWEAAIASQTGQFLVDFRSKFLQFGGIQSVNRFIENLVHAFCNSLLLDRVNGWERISRIDLATDTQLEHAPTWQDLPRYVTRARKKDVVSDSQEYELQQAREVLNELSGKPPLPGNKGGGTYKITDEQVSKLQAALAAMEHQHVSDGYIYRALYTREIQSVYFGRFASSLFGIRYDKLASLKVQRKEYLAEIWKKNGWDGVSPVWRTEFRLSSPFLRQAGLILEDESKIQDLREWSLFIQHIGKVWRYLTTDWLRLTIPDENDSNNRRWDLDPEWEVIQDAFPSAEAIKRYPPKKNPIESQMVAQMRGVALTIAARRAASDLDGDSAIDVLNDLAQFFADETYTLRLADRRRLLGCDDYSHAALAHKLRAEWMREGNGS